MITTVFVDIDDTLLDFGACSRQATRLGFEERGIPYSDKVHETFTRINDAMWLQLEKGTLTRAQHRLTRWNNIFRELGIAFDGADFEKTFRKYMAQSHVKVEGADEFLKKVSSSFTLCAASNALDGDEQRKRLELAGLLGYFDFVFISGELGAPKPSKEFFNACFERLEGVEPDEVFFLGDSPTADIQGGKSYGLVTCLFDPKSKYPHCDGADFTVRSLNEAEKLAASL